MLKLQDERILNRKITDHINDGEKHNGDLTFCTNTTPLTVTLSASPSTNDRATVVRLGTGEVTIDGNGNTIIGEATQNLPMQYDAADLVYTGTEWVLT